MIHTSYKPNKQQSYNYTILQYVNTFLWPYKWSDDWKHVYNYNITQSKPPSQWILIMVYILKYSNVSSTLGLVRLQNSPHLAHCFIKPGFFVSAHWAITWNDVVLGILSSTYISYGKLGRSKHGDNEVKLLTKVWSTVVSLETCFWEQTMVLDYSNDLWHINWAQGSLMGT